MTTAFGQLLAEYRTRAGLAQQALSAAAGFDKSLVCHWENGNRKPLRSSVEQLAEALNLNAADTARLLASAGFVAEMEPVVSDLAAFLADAGLPHEVRDDVRNMIALLVRQARRVRVEAA